MSMEAAVVAGVAIVALVAGAILGWVFASRQIAPLGAERDARASDAEDWRVKFNEAVVNLAAEAEKTKRLADVEAQLTIERESTAALREKVAAFERLLADNAGSPAPGRRALLRAHLPFEVARAATGPKDELALGEAG